MTSQLADLLGLDGDAVGLANLERAAVRVMARLGVSDHARYLAILRADPDERRRLAGEAVVQETWFFRDGEPFSLLGRLARDLPRPLRLLSAPCASGEEPYSMAMALMEAGMSPDEFRVDAADAHAPALDKARLGHFWPGSFRRELGAHARYFTPDGPEMLVSAQVRRTVHFFEGDVLDPLFLHDALPYDVIFCRNLLLYLAPPARRMLAETLKRLLTPGGLLFTGHAEVAVLTGLGFVSAPHPKAFAVTHALPDDATLPCTLTGILPSTVPYRYPASPSATISASAFAPADPATWPERRQSPELSADAGQQGMPLNAPASGQQGSPLAAPNPTRTGDPRALADAGRLDEALAVLEKDLAVLGPSAERFHLMGVTFLALGRGREAEDALRKAVYLDPGHAGALTHLELLHAATGRTEAAKRLAGRAKRAGGKRP